MLLNFVLRAARYGIAPSLLLLASAASQAQSFNLRVITKKLENPSEIVGHPTNPGLLYSLDRTGILNAIFLPASPKEFPFPQIPMLNLTNTVDSSVHQGFLGLAFHPQFATNRRLFLKYNELVPNGNGSSNLVIEEFRMMANSPIALEPNFTPVRIFCAPTFGMIHMGGGIEFGPDGKLWVPLGDSGVRDLAQDLSSPWGKVLRFDVDVNVGQQAGCGQDSLYVPNDNPPLGGNAYIWSIGLRSPFSWSFDSQALGGNDDLWIGDVGSNGFMGNQTFEEINRTSWPSSGGEDYGWDLCEGIPGAGACPGSESPVFVYANIPGSACKAVIGGHVYRGQDIPSMQGRYIFADFCSAMFAAPDAPETLRSFSTSGNPNASITNHGGATNRQVRGPVGFCTAADGEMYLIDLNENGSTGRLLKLVP